MSRSRRRTPIHANCGGEPSEKKDKKEWHSRMRAREREALHRGDEVFPHEYEVSNPWTMQKDGKSRWEFDDEWEDEKKTRWRRTMQK